MLEYLYRWLRISLIASGANPYTYAWHHSIAYASAIAVTHTNAGAIQSRHYRPCARSQRRTSSWLSDRFTGAWSRGLPSCYANQR